jgi:hypothetical protein
MTFWTHTMLTMWGQIGEGEGVRARIMVCIQQSANAAGGDGSRGGMTVEEGQ